MKLKALQPGEQGILEADFLGLVKPSYDDNPYQTLDDSLEGKLETIMLSKIVPERLIRLILPVVNNIQR